jgi:hypothetical protein
MGPDGAFITGSDFLMDGGVTDVYWFGDLAPTQQAVRWEGKPLPLQNCRTALRSENPMTSGMSGVNSPNYPAARSSAMTSMRPNGRGQRKLIMDKRKYFYIIPRDLYP